MSEVAPRPEAARGLAARPGQPSLDYYLIHPDRGSATQPAGILVEEFVLAEDYSAVRLDSTGWTPKGRHWWSSAAFSRAVRINANLRGRVVATTRREAEITHRQLGGGELPAEETLRTYFHDGEPLSTSAPLRLRPDQVTAGFHDTRSYRILFANELDRDGLANLQATWRMAVTDDLADPRARIVGTAHLRVGDDAFTWDLRRIGPGVAWCLDLTTNLATGSGATIGPLLRELTTAMRTQGLIPVTIERFG